MYIYNKIEDFMNKYFYDQMFHSPIDEILKDIDTVKPKYRFPCEVEQHLYIDKKHIVLHHYKRKYKEVMLFFPGGSFCYPPTIFHYKFAKKMAKKYKKHVIMVQYPLFPEVNPLHTTIIIRKLIDKLKLKDIYLIGDSAGANLAIYVLHSLHMDNLHIVKKTILISPWVDGDLIDERVRTIQQYDFILYKDNCVKIASDVYSKYINGRTYLFPKNEGFRFEDDILIISGEHEIFTYDAIQWTLQQDTLKVKHLVFKNLCHCFIILPIKEAKYAMNQIKIFLA